MPLKVVRRKASAQLYIRGTVRGIRVFETTGTDRWEEAEAIRIKRESEVLERSIFGPGATITFAEACVSYLEGGGEAKYLGCYDDANDRWTLLIGRLGTVPLVKIGQSEIDDAARSLYPKAGPATRKRQVYAPMCAVLNHAAHRGWLAPPKIKHPKVPKPETKWSSAERLNRLLPHLRPPLRRLVIFLTYTGARLSEALAVDWDRDINLEARTIILRKTKNGNMRPLFVPDQLLEELAKVDSRKRRGPLFPWKSKNSVHRPLKRACARAGVEYLPPHQQGRHTYATWMRSYGGLDLRGLMEAGGWESPASVARYAHVMPGEAARAVARLPILEKQDDKVIRTADYKDKARRKKRPPSL
jgi:integrase